jgi:hypothetical protein
MGEEKTILARIAPKPQKRRQTGDFSLAAEGQIP